MFNLYTTSKNIFNKNSIKIIYCIQIYYYNGDQEENVQLPFLSKIF
jgi:hypothetical protein